VKRRDFITLLGGAAAWPLAARAQQPGRMRLVGVLFLSDNRPEWAAALRQELERLGWVEGRTLRIDYRYSGGDLARVTANAAELVNLGPDVIFATGSPAIRAVQQRTQTIPIVFVGGGDVSNSSLTGGITRPAGNTTGFANVFNSEGGKWLELLKDAAPRITRVAHVRNFDTFDSQLAAIIEAAAAKLAITMVRVPYRSDVAEMERAINEFAVEPNGALLMSGVRPATGIFDAVLRQAVQHHLPTIDGAARGVQEGLLMSYGPDILDLIRGAASDIDRILRGAKPSELPVQFPTKIPLVINLRTAKAITLEIPAAMLLRADEVIE
jgi:putative tryptophan/tyrosine transport system substrate-binding protein